MKEKYINNSNIQRLKNISYIIIINKLTFYRNDNLYIFHFINKLFFSF